MPSHESQDNLPFNNLEQTDEELDRLAKETILEVNKLAMEPLKLDIPEEEGGLRRDLIACLLGELKPNELKKPFTKRQLQACYIEMVRRKPKTDWRSNFLSLQESPMYQNEEKKRMDTLMNKLLNRE